MMLVIDIGNTRIKWGQWQGDALQWSRSQVYTADPGPHELRQWFEDTDCTEGVVIGSVASDAVNQRLGSWFERDCQCTPRFMRASSRQAGLINGYAEPRRLGVDRWAAMIAARAACEGPLCVIDCGSAITLDVVDAAGVHLGGLIMPGLDLMRRALVSGAAGIDDEAGEPVSLADNTADAVFSGGLRLAAAGLAGLLNDYARTIDPAIRCVMTGGDAPRLAGIMNIDCIYDPDLVLKGLARMALD